VSLFTNEDGPAPVVVYQMTAGQLEELVERIAVRVTQGPRKAAVKVPEAARLLGIGVDALRYRIEAKLVKTLPDIGPIRIAMDEIDRLNGMAAAKRRRSC